MQGVAWKCDVCGAIDVAPLGQMPKYWSVMEAYLRDTELFIKLDVCLSRDCQNKVARINNPGVIGAK